MGAVLILPFAGLEVACSYLFLSKFSLEPTKRVNFLTNERIKLERGRLIKEFTWEEFRSFTVLTVT